MATKKVFKKKKVVAKPKALHVRVSAKAYEKISKFAATNKLTKGQTVTLMALNKAL